MPHYSTTCKPIAREQPALPLPRPQSKARWITANPADALCEGNVAGLLLTVPRARRDGCWDMYETAYTVYAQDGEWHLLKDGDKGTISEHYIVDPSFGPKPEHWTCRKVVSTPSGTREVPCPSVTRARPVCKHCLGCGAALRHIGILPPVETPAAVAEVA